MTIKNKFNKTVEQAVLAAFTSNPGKLFSRYDIAEIMEQSGLDAVGADAYPMMHQLRNNHKEGIFVNVQGYGYKYYPARQPA